VEFGNGEEEYLDLCLMGNAGMQAWSSEQWVGSGDLWAQSVNNRSFKKMDERNRWRSGWKVWEE